MSDVIDGRDLRVNGAMGHSAARTGIHARHGALDVSGFNFALPFGRRYLRIFPFPPSQENQHVNRTAFRRFDRGLQSYVDINAKEEAVLAVSLCYLASFCWIVTSVSVHAELPFEDRV